MNRMQIILVQISVWTLTLTGAVFAWMKYGMTSDDPFAVANHPLQPSMLVIHLLAAPFAVFAFGWLFADHVLPKLSNGNPKRKRISGLSALWIIPAMVMTGYALQVAVADWLRLGASAAHWITSAVFLVAYVVHFRKM